jgi:hypothetical protein
MKRTNESRRHFDPNSRRKKAIVVGLAGLTLAASGCRVQGHAKNNGVTYVGDSITVEEALYTNLPLVDAEHGLRFVDTEANIGHRLVGGARPDGMQEIRDKSQAIRQSGTVVLELGTNPTYNPKDPTTHISPEQMQHDAEAAVDLVHSYNPNTHIVWDDLLTSRPGQTAELSGRNAGIYAAQKTRHFVVYSWSKTAEGNNADPMNLRPGPDSPLIRGDLQGGVHPGSPQSALVRAQAEATVIAAQAFGDTIVP